MKRNRFIRSQVRAILKEVERTGDRTTVGRRYNMPASALDHWHRTTGLTDVCTTARLQTLDVEEEDAWLKRLLASRYAGKRRPGPD